MATQLWDLLDRRILACVAFVDARGRAVTTPIAIDGPDGFRSFWKRPGMLIVTNAPGLAGHSAAFDTAPAVPARGSVKLTISARPSDPGLGARSFELALPRDPNPDVADSIFDAAQVVLPPTPSARIEGLAAGLRVGVTRSSDGAAIEGALVRLKPAGGRPQTIALTDAAGEALLIASAIPLATPGPGAVMQSDFAATLDAVIVPAKVRINAAPDVFAARSAAAARTTGFVDPDKLDAAPTPAQDVRIAAGRVMTAVIGWTPP